MGCFLFHSWSDWTPAADKCEEIQKCTKCGEVKARPAHNMTEWARIAPNVCAEERHCANPWCNVKETRQTKHQWAGDWAYYEDGCCTQVKTCAVCGETEYREKCPDKPEIIEVPGECRVIERCPRCGLESTHSTEHDWTEPALMREIIESRIAQTRASMQAAQPTAVLSALSKGRTSLSEIAANQTAVTQATAADKAYLQTCPPDRFGRMCKKCMTVQQVGKRMPPKEI